MNVQRMRSLGVAAGLLVVSTVGVSTASAYTVPVSTPPGITLVDTMSPAVEAVPMLLWRRLGDASGNALYIYQADQAGKSSCYGDCAKEFPPVAADAHAKALGDFSIIDRDDHVKQWAYQGKPLYRYSGKDPVGEPELLNRGEAGKDPAQFDPSSKIYSPKVGWSRAAYTPEKTLPMPPDVQLDGIAVANGFGFVDAASHMTIYAAPVSHKLSGDWLPVSAPALATPIGEFAIITRKDDATRQWTYKGEALYTYAGDYAPGEVTGIFSGDRSIQAALAYENFNPPGVEVGHYLGRGPLMTSKGLTLYYVTRFYALYGGRETRLGYSITYNDAKSQGTGGCEGDCIKTWKPLLAAANAQAGGFWEIVARPDGSKQWAFKGSPVYTYIGDKKGGDIAGNNRHVVMYGGADGKIVYEDVDPDPHNPTLIGNNITMVFATGAHPELIDPIPAATADTQGAGGANGGGAGKRARGAAGGAAADGAGANNGNNAAARRQAAAQGTPGAGFYWHTVPLFY